MAGIRLKKVLTDFNIGMSTLVNFLEKKGITIDPSPMTKLDDETYALVQKEFLPQQQVKEDAKKIAGTLRIPESEKKATYQLEKEEKPKEIETFIETTVETPKTPTVLGKIDLGKFDKKAKEEVKEEKKEEPKAKEEVKEKKVQAPEPEPEKKEEVAPVKEEEKKEEKKVEAPKTPEKKAEEKPQPEQQKQPEQKQPKEEVKSNFIETKVEQLQGPKDTGQRIDLSKFETLPEMKEQQAFENCLERELRVIAPILYGILHSSFLPVLAFDDQTPGKITLYRDDMLIPYSELLLLNRQEIYSDAKIKLPFWHSIPILSWIMSFIVKKSKARRDKDAKKTSSQKMIQEEKENADKKKQELDSKDLGDPQKNRKRVVRQQASEVEQVLVPANSTLNRELDSYLHEWNDRLGQKSHDNLTEDVNTLIRDYTRKILRTFKNENFSVERVDSLAQSLVDSPALMKVKNHPALKHYIELYMTKLIKNLP